MGIPGCRDRGKRCIIRGMDSSSQAKKERPRGFVPEPFEYHEVVELDIETLTNLGQGLGRIHNWVVMVPFCLPGEKVRARIFRNKSNYSEADLLEVLQPSPHRVDPACPLFTECGGCQYQHLAYPEQLAWKESQVREIYQRIGGLENPPVLSTHPSPRQYGYRSKLTPHWEKPRRGEQPGAIGFLRYGNRRQILDVPQCSIATEAINAELPAARQALRESYSKRGKKPKGGTLMLRDVMEGVVTRTDEVVTERVGDFSFQFRAGDFFQNNPFILPELVEAVGRAADVEGMDFLVDAYCGTGLFAISLSRRFERVAGVEIAASAVQWATNNAAINRVNNCEFSVGSAEAIFESVTFPPAQTVFIVDPPRKGCDSVFLNQLFAFRPHRVVYVSCDPSTQARDIKACLENGYRLLEVEPFDLFPQTRHIESLAVLERGE